jgi:hypothetical protein
MRLHRIASPAMIDLGYSSKLNAEWSFLCMLRDEGRRTAERWLENMARTWASAQPMRSTTCWRACEPWV